jgi:uncharacterized protein YcbK (DUF882 family)
MGDLTRNFSRSEFRCKCDCGADHIELELVRLLQEIRDMMGEPIYINSGVRCEKYNQWVGGVPNSEHISGEAADIKCENSNDRYHMMIECLRKFVRVGLALDFIHVGIGRGRVLDVLWLYPPKEKPYEEYPTIF